jgi:putative transposase
VLTVQQEYQRVFLKEQFILILSRLKRLVGTSMKVLRARFVHWTKPLTSSLPLGTLADLGRSKSELIAENALLRQQLIMLKRQVKRPVCTKTDRILLVLLARAVRAWKQALLIAQPETLLHWHREAFRLFWSRKSKVHSHKPRVTAETIMSIREMTTKNRLWGAERIRGELLKLGIHVCKRTIQKYMRSVRTSQSAGQKWATCLRNHAAQIWARDALSDHRSLLSTALCVLQHPPQVTQGDPRGRNTISDRSLGCATPARSYSLWASAKVPGSC